MNGMANFMRKMVYTFVLILVLGLAAFVCVNYYSIIFAKTVEGQVIEVDRVTQPTVVMGNAMAKAENVLYSFAVAVRTPEGKIFSGSSEDRQWAIVQKGICVKAKFFPYPPWDFDKGGTYYNVRMQQLQDCPAGTPALPQQATEKPEPIVPTEAPAPPQPAVPQ